MHWKERESGKEDEENLDNKIQIEIDTEIRQIDKKSQAKFKQENIPRKREREKESDSFCQLLIDW